MPSDPAREQQRGASSLPPIFVTGASGFIGSHLIDSLVSQGASLRGLTRRSPDKLRWANPRCTYVQGDINDPHALEAGLREARLVFHLAAELKMGQVGANTLQTTNYRGTTSLLKACLAQGVEKLVYCSSCGVFGDTGFEPVDENKPPTPEDPYEWSKFQAEKAVMDFAHKYPQVKVVIIRPAWVYGPRDSRTLKLFRLIAKGRLFIAGSGKNRIHPVHVSDVVQGLIAAAIFEVPQGSIYNIAGPDILELQLFLEKIAQQLETRLIPVKIPLAPLWWLACILEPLFKAFGKEAPLTRGKLGFFKKNRVYSIAKAGQNLAYHPQISITEGLAHTLQWYKRQHLL